MRKLFVALGMLVVWSPLAQAEPLNAKHVPAGAKWVMHVDLDGFKASKMGQYCRHKMLQKERVKAKLEKLKTEFGFDPREDLHGMTLFDTKIKPHHGLLMIHADKLNSSKVHARFQKDHPDHKSSEYHGHSLSTWTERKGKKHEHKVTGCFHGDSMILLSREPKILKKTLDVLDGRAPSVAANSPLVADTSPGTIALVRAIDMAGMKMPRKSSILKGAKRFSMSAGEHQGQIFVQSKLVAKSGEVANNLRSVVEGFRALGMLRFGSDETMRKAIEGLTVVVADATIMSEWRIGLEDAQKLGEKMKEHHRKMRHHRGKHGHRKGHHHGRHHHRKHGDKDKSKGEKKSDEKKSEA